MAGDVPTLASDGNWRVSWVTTIADISGPTVAELDAGTELAADFITPDGLNITPSTEGRDTSTLGSTFTTMRAGRRSFENSVTCLRAEDGSPDTAYDTLVFRATGYLVVRRTLPNADAYAAGQTVEVYPAECGEPQLSAPAPNATQTFTTPFYVTSEPDTRATVAA